MRVSDTSTTVECVLLSVISTTAECVLVLLPQQEALHSLPATATAAQRQSTVPSPCVALPPTPYPAPLDRLFPPPPSPHPPTRPELPAARTAA